MGFRGKPSGVIVLAELAFLVPRIQVIAIEQFERSHGHLARVLIDLEQHGAGATIAEIDDHVNVERFATLGHGRADHELNATQLFHRLAVQAHDVSQSQREIVTQRTRLVKIALGQITFLTARSVHGQKEAIGLSRLQNLPLNERIRLPLVVFQANTSLPAVTDDAARKAQTFG